MPRVGVIQDRSPTAGERRLRLMDIKDVQGKFNKPAYEFLFEVTEGPEAGRQITKITGINAKLGESLGDFLVELAGRQLVKGDKVDIDSFIGHEFNAVLEANADNRVSISEVSPVKSAT